MRTPEPALLPLFRSQSQLDLLGVLFSSPSEVTVSELASRINAPLSTVAREVTRLAQAGLLATRSSRGSKLVSARRDYSWAPALAELLDRTVGITSIVERQLAEVDGIETAYVFGSWAARKHGRLGPPPHDLDLLIIGSPTAFALTGARRRIEADSGLRVDVIVIDTERFAHPEGDPVLTDIVSGALVELNLDRDHG